MQASALQKRLEGQKYENKTPMIQDLSLVGPGGDTKMGGISLKGAQSPFVRGVSISGFSIGINADNSVSARIEDVKVSLSKEEAFTIVLSEQFPDLSVAQLITVMHVMKTLQADESKNGSDLEKISKTLSGVSKLAEVASRVWGNFFP